MNKIIVLLLLSACMQGSAQEQQLFYNNIMSPYFAMKNALTADNADSAARAAAVLHQSVKDFPAGELSESNSKLWTAHAAAISSDAEQISKSTDIKMQRSLLASISKNLYPLAKSFSESRQTVYYQFCPMAMEGKGAYWLSETEKIRNPYYGKKMYTCGSTRERLQ
jgi:hypothetical protein